MKYFIYSVIALCLMANQAYATINIFACEPEWGALAQEIGGDQVDVYTATTAKQDPHFIQARPSLLARIRKADLVFCNGAELEVGWLPLLLRQAANGKVQEGSAGYIMASDVIKKLEIPRSVDRSMGDVHPDGNPHFVTSPKNLLPVALLLRDRLIAKDPEHKDYFTSRYETFVTKLTHAIEDWEAKASVLRGVGFIYRHAAFAYLEDWLGLRRIGVLEPKPGIPPTTEHLARLLEAHNKTPARAIVLTGFEDPKGAKWLAEKTNLLIITLPYTVGGSANAQDLFGLYESTIQQLVEGIKQ